MMMDRALLNGKLLEFDAMPLVINEVFDQIVEDYRPVDPQKQPQMHAILNVMANSPSIRIWLPDSSDINKQHYKLSLNSTYATANMSDICRQHPSSLPQYADTSSLSLSLGVVYAVSKLLLTPLSFLRGAAAFFYYDHSFLLCTALIVFQRNVLEKAMLTPGKAESDDFLLGCLSFHMKLTGRVFHRIRLLTVRKLKLQKF
eukprot:gene1571-955_t